MNQSPFRCTAAILPIAISICLLSAVSGATLVFDLTVASVESGTCGCEVGESVQVTVEFDENALDFGDDDPTQGFFSESISNVIVDFANCADFEFTPLDIDDSNLIFIDQDSDTPLESGIIVAGNELLPSQPFLSLGFLNSLFDGSPGTAVIDDPNILSDSLGIFTDFDQFELPNGNPAFFRSADCHVTFAVPEPSRFGLLFIAVLVGIRRRIAQHTKW